MKKATRSQAKLSNNTAGFTPLLQKKIDNRVLETEVRVHTLVKNPLNPPERTETNTAYLNLRRGIRKYGVISPIHFCGETMFILDGHRRWRCAQENGIQVVPAYRYDDLLQEERNMLFKHLNTTAIKYNSSQELFTYLEGGEVSPATIKTCDHIQQAGDYEKLGNGMKCLNTIRKRRKSPVSYSVGINEYCKVVGDNSLKHQSDALRWMMEIGSAHKLKSLISLKCPSHLIQEAVEKQRPVIGTWEISA